MPVALGKCSSGVVPYERFRPEVSGQMSSEGKTLITSTTYMVIRKTAFEVNLCNHVSSWRSVVGQYIQELWGTVRVGQKEDISAYVPS